MAHRATLQELTKQRLSSCLPTDGSTIWVRLTTIGGANSYQDYQYTAQSLTQATTTVVSSTANPSTYGGSVSFTATVMAGSNPVTSGTVQFVVDGTNYGSAVTLNASGQATSQATDDVDGRDAHGPGELPRQRLLPGQQWLAEPDPDSQQGRADGTANDASKVYGDALPTFTASYNGFVNGDGQGVLTGSPSLTTTATSSSPVGSYTIRQLRARWRRRTTRSFRQRKPGHHAEGRLGDSECRQQDLRHIRSGAYRHAHRLPAG